MTLLEVSGLSAGYGAARVIHDIDLVVEEGSVVAVLGANGAGKTTTLRAVSGALSRVQGRVTFDGRDHTRVGMENAVKAGISHVPQGRGTFTNQTVDENLRLGGYLRDRRQARKGADEVYDLFPQLSDRRRQRAGTLSGGEQQMLAIGRAMMSDPRLVLLDEPSLGLAPQLTVRVFDALATWVRSSKVSMVIVEQHAQLALGLAEHAYVLESGRIAFSGTPDEINSDTSLRRAYLGA